MARAGKLPSQNTALHHHSPPGLSRIMTTISGVSRSVSTSAAHPAPPSAEGGAVVSYKKRGAHPRGVLPCWLPRRSRAWRAPARRCRALRGALRLCRGLRGRKGRGPSAGRACGGRPPLFARRPPHVHPRAVRGRRDLLCSASGQSLSALCSCPPGPCWECQKSGRPCEAGP